MAIHTLVAAARSAPHFRQLHGMIHASLASSWPPHSTQGVGDLQPNYASRVIRIVVWSFAGLVVLCVLLLSATAATLPGCTKCHQSPGFAEQTAKGAHSEVACVRCHVQPGAVARLEYAYHMIFGMRLRLAPTGTGPISGIPDRTCLSCHEAVMKRIVKLNGLSIQHSTCSEGRMCTECHSETAHGSAVKWPKTVQMNQCLSCHSTSQVRTNCSICHEKRSPDQRLRSGEWAVTHGSNWKQTHGMGTLSTCASCHPSDYCVRCHGIPLPHNADFIRMHPLQAQTNRQDCAVCHKQTFCDNCHKTEMPHPQAFTPSHPAVVRQRGQAVCRRCHLESDCTDCHLRHVHPGGATLPPRTGL